MAGTKNIYFVTDAHLGSLAFDSRENEKKLCRWMDHIRQDCEALYILGDMMDFWYEYKRVVPKGYVRFFGRLAEFVDAGIPVYWSAGNHDIWLFRYLQEEIGVVVYHQPILVEWHGKKFFIDHGDGLGDSTFGTHFLSAVFKSKVAQWLFSHLLHPDAALSFGLRWSRHSFEKRKKEDSTAYLGEDKEYLLRFAKEYAQTHPENTPDYYVFGHRHILLDMQLANKSRVIILGDWINEFSYGLFDGTDFLVEHYEE